MDSKQCKEMRMQIFHFDESYIMRRRKCLSFPDAQCPKILLNSSISRSSRNEPKRLYTNTRFLAPNLMHNKNSRPKMPKTMQFHYFKCKDAPNLMHNKKLIFFISKIAKIKFKIFKMTVIKPNKSPQNHI